MLKTNKKPKHFFVKKALSTFDFRLSTFHSGQAILTAVVFFMFVSMIVVSGAYTVSYKESKSSRDFGTSKKSFFMAESGLEDLAYRMIKGKNYDTVETLSLDGFFATTTVADISGDKEITATGTASKMIRRSKIKLEAGGGTSFFYGTQTGEGGIVMSNSSEVIGNVFSNGPVVGHNSNIVRGDVISAGPSGLVDGIHATGTAYAHTIRDSNIDKDAHYTTISGANVGGISYPNSPDQATSSLPISDAQIDAWKTEASAGGTHSSPCPYNISGAVSIGPKKINCDLNISGSAVVTLGGPVWVSGNINFSNTADVKINSSLGDKSVAVIADKETNRSSGSRIFISNTVEFFGSGNDKSYILLVSRNNNAEGGGSTSAIDISNSANGKILLYAPHGLMYLSNSISVKEASAYKIQLSNSAKIIYETGLSNLLFTSGPSGGYSIESWREGE
ncbi:MAG: hypothetical protein UW04_C0007G0009 [Parcubacteria group bacterium GW2011_GWB1_43_8]|nr:MAG: hypothetical protein UW04_C0007G0009 [Parcubacteria group bacterium GW2011_GWB1_43_8]